MFYRRYYNEKRLDDLILRIKMQTVIFLIIFSFPQFCLSCIPSCPQCGCPEQSPTISRSRIVGGHVARKHSWPWIGK
jgi:hypothetical protein